MSQRERSLPPTAPALVRAWEERAHQATRRTSVQGRDYVLHIDRTAEKTFCGRLVGSVNRTPNPDQEPIDALCRACARERSRAGEPPHPEERAFIASHGTFGRIVREQKERTKRLGSPFAPDPRRERLEAIARGDGKLTELDPSRTALPSLRSLREAAAPTAEELAARPARAAAGGVKPGPGLTQGELAARTKRHVRNMISQWERGAKVPSLEARATLLRALCVTATLEQIQAWTVAK